MNITLLSYEYPPETGFGGIGTYTYYQARALAKLGHEVRVLAGSTYPIRKETEHDGVRVHRYRRDDLFMRGLSHLNHLRLKWTGNRLETGWNMFHSLKSLLQTEHQDVVEMPECGAEGLLVNNFWTGQTVVKFHSPAQLIMRYYDVAPKDITFCSLVEKLGFQRATRFTSCSDFLAKEVSDKLRVRRPIRVIPNGIDLALFDAAEEVDVRAKFGIPRDRPMVFFSGRMERRKGIHLCKDIAASILKRYEVAMVFAGQDLFNYMSDTLLPFINSKALRGSIHYLGKLNLTEVHSCLKQTDVFLLPSLWENRPYSCLEAMAAGRAIVAANQGGMPELIADEENGLLAVSEDPFSYVSKLERLIEDKGLRVRLGSAARRTVEQHFTDVEVARKSLELYREIAGR